MATPPKLTLAPYLQHWDAATHTITVNLLVLPTGSPFIPLGSGLGAPNPGPGFADANLVFKAYVSKSWQQMPGFSLVDEQQVLSPAMPANRHAIFNELAAQLQITKAEQVAQRKPSQMVRKHLMNSYKNAFAFVAPKTPLAFTDDTYSCLMKCPPKTGITPPVIDKSVSWAEAISFGLRQPKLASEMGVIYQLKVKITPADLLKNGGWLFISLDASSDYQDLLGTAGFIKVFGTRIPALSIATGRQLFTPVVFPVVDDPTITILPGNFDQAFIEAARYNDGFAKIVHGSQPVFRDTLKEAGDNGPAPVREEGVQLGWDDEDIVIAHNRQMGVEPDTMTVPAEAPTGTVGYRIDVRTPGETNWHTLSKVQADDYTFAGIDFGAMDWELRTEVFPSTVQEQFWLPSYFTRWKGGSLVTTDDDDLLLRRGLERATPLYFHSEDANEVSLQYGNKYEFRVRMVDVTNGGPQLEDDLLLPGEAPVCGISFKRFVPPGLLSWPEVDPNPRQASLTQYTISRPLIGLPQALYTAYPNVKATLLTIQQGNRGLPGTATTDPSVPDIDTPLLSIRVLVRTPDFDPNPLPRDNEGYIEWYSTTRAFPTDLNDPYLLNIDFSDADLLSDIDISAQSGTNPTGPIQVPTARDIKIELQAVGIANDDYFGNERARFGAVSAIKLHKVATAENNFLLPQIPQDTLRSVYLQPSNIEGELQPTAVVLQNNALPVLVQRLAGAASLNVNDTTLMMPPGQRGIFGCSGGLKHYLPANNSSLVLMASGELSHQWLNILHWEINRDWTWKGFSAPVFTVEREILLNGNSYTEPRKKVGEVKMMHAVTPLIAEQGEADRSRSHFVFVDAFQPPLGSDGKPYEVIVNYYLTIAFENGDMQSASVSNTLPITTTPRKIPKVVSAGVALSPYTIGDGYASTGDRRKMLWLEFDQAPPDSRDAYFVRVLAQTADPMLLQSYQPLAEPAGYLQSTLDPELIRIVTPGQADDYAGLTTMQRLLPAADSDRHFLVPLPNGTYPDSPELFGFYTYEIRVGHDKGTPGNPFWSTAQGRFGPAVILDGVQHPCSPLHCNIFRVKPGILASASYAKAFSQGADIQALPPNTEIWFILYAQVSQADGSSMRNVELDKRKGTIILKRQAAQLKKLTGISLVNEDQAVSTIKGRTIVQNIQAPLQAHMLWEQSEIIALLADNGLSEDTPLSILGVELLPEPTGHFGDPLGGDLGQVRILRTSALYQVDSLCC